MKLLVSLLTAFSVGYATQRAMLWVGHLSRPAPDYATQRLRSVVEHLLTKNRFMLLSRYINHITPLLKETPLPPSLDSPLFLSLHIVAGLPIWILAAFAFPKSAIGLLPVSLGVGAALPYIWLKQKQKQFHTRLLKALPDYLELQALVMEAGLDLHAGLQHYLDKGTSSPLQTLLRGTQKEIQMGRSRTDAFIHLGQKTSFSPLRDTCRGIVQALALGTSLAPMLRQQAAALRVYRMRIAEKKAAEAPLKVLFPLFVFIFPTIFIVLLGPMVLLFAQGGF